MRTCACGKIATFHCSACYKHDAPESAHMYCSKECQKVAWKFHKIHCKFTVFYSRVRDLPCEEAAQARAVAAEMATEKRPILQHFLDDNMEYIKRVPRSNRPLRYCDKVFRFKPEVEAFAKDFAQDRREYMKEWSTRVPKEMQNKCNNGREWEVPLSCRKIHYDPHGQVKYYFKVFPEDIETMSYKLFTENFTGRFEVRIDFEKNQLVKHVQRVGVVDVYEDGVVRPCGNRMTFQLG